MELNQTTHDGEFTIRTFGDELRMSHWVYNPEIYDKTGNVVFSLKGSDCDLRDFKYTHGCWLLKVYKYPNGMNGMDVILDFQKDIGYIDDVRFESITDLENQLRKADS